MNPRGNEFLKTEDSLPLFTKLSLFSHLDRVGLNDCVIAMWVSLNISFLVCLPDLQREAQVYISQTPLQLRFWMWFRINQSVLTWDLKEESVAETMCLLFLLASMDMDVLGFSQQSYYDSSVHHWIHGCQEAGYRYMYLVCILPGVHGSGTGSTVVS